MGSERMQPRLQSSLSEAAVRGVLRELGETQELSSLVCARNWVIPLPKMLVLSLCRKPIGNGNLIL